MHAYDDSCRRRDVAWMWGVASGYVGCAVRLYVYESTRLAGWLHGLSERVLIRSSTLWLLPLQKLPLERATSTLAALGRSLRFPKVSERLSTTTCQGVA